MKKVILSLILTVMLIVLTGCTDVVAEEEKRFIKISDEGAFYICYDKKTKVEYAVSNGYYNYGTITVLVDAEGKPLLYEGD